MAWAVCYREGKRGCSKVVRGERAIAGGGDREAKSLGLNVGQKQVEEVDFVRKLQHRKVDHLACVVDRVKEKRVKKKEIEQL